MENIQSTLNLLPSLSNISLAPLLKIIKATAVVLPKNCFIICMKDMRQINVNGVVSLWGLNTGRTFLMQSWATTSE
jgi:hypothetical protein